MRVAHVICTFPPYKGGMGNSVYNAAIELGKRGHESVVFTPAYKGVTAGQEIIGENASVFRLKPLIYFGNAAILPQLFYLLKDFDIVHLHYPFYGTADIVALLALFRKIKLVIHYHMDGVINNWKGIVFWFYSFFFLPVIARLAVMITCASLDYIKHSQLGAFYVNHRASFIEVPFGVDAEMFYPGEKDRQPIILFVGALDKQHYFKGIEKLIEAFSMIASKNNLAKLVLIGKGNLENYYYKLAVKKKIVNQLQIINSASDQDLANWYRLASVLVLPSINQSEAFGLVLLEAMSCATPVIASNLPGVRNVFKNKEHGFLIKPGDAEALAQKLDYLLNNPELARKMGDAARDFIEERYSWQKVGERLEAAYFRILYLPKKNS